MIKKFGAVLRLTLKKIVSVQYLANQYCSKIAVQDSLFISVYSPTTLCVLISHFKGEKFPKKREIHFINSKIAIGLVAGEY